MLHFSILLYTWVTNRLCDPGTLGKGWQWLVPWRPWSAAQVRALVSSTSQGPQLIVGTSTPSHCCPPPELLCTVQCTVHSAVHSAQCSAHCALCARAPGAVGALGTSSHCPASRRSELIKTRRRSMPATAALCCGATAGSGYCGVHLPLGWDRRPLCCSGLFS